MAKNKDQKRNDTIEEIFNDDSSSLEGMFIDGEEPNNIIDLNSNSVNDFVEAAPLKETVPSSENKTTVISFYVSDQLLADFLELVEENKIVKSKVIRAAEELYFNSKFDSTHSTRSSLEKRKNKLTCAFVKSELVKRAENKGFKKTTDYLNEVLIKKMNKVF